MNDGRGLVPLGLLLCAVLAAVGIQLHDAHRESRGAAELRFEQRAEISAALMESVFGALGSVSANELTRRYGGGPRSKLNARLTQDVKRNTFGYMAIFDARGIPIAQAGAPVPPTRAANGTRGILPNVRQTALGPLIDFELPFRASDGQRKVLAGVPVSFMRKFLEVYLRRLPNPDRAALMLADQRGAVLARVTPQGADRSADDPLVATAAVPGTRWLLQLRADRARVLAGSGGGMWLGWALLGGLAIAMLAVLWLCARVFASSRRTNAANLAVRESESKLRALVGALEEAVLLLHADGRVELLNASARALAESSADIFTNLRTDWLSVDDDGAPMAAADTPAGRSFAQGTVERRVIGVDRPGEERIWLDVSSRPLTRPGEAMPYAVVCSCIDVTERQNLEAHLLELADRDPLTGLWNRRRFEQDLAQQLDRCRRYDERAVLVLMDVDGFKQVNDRLGHLIGDEVLCALGDTLSTRLRSSDRAARLGGDEFVLLVLDVDAAGAERIATELTRLMCDAAARAQDGARLSISIGTTPLDRSSGSVNEALETADRAMYASKQRQGRRPVGTATLPPAVAATAEMASVRALLAAVSARDSYTAMHSREVVTLARAVSRQLDLDETQTSEVEHIALLHDLGKIAVPDAILRKADPLTSHEQTLMRQHPVVGAEILASMPELAHLAAAVRAEHERWDGGGYPDGLVGEQIPIASRITLVCDAFHAMTSNRPYRRAMSASAARAEIREAAGTQFCPYASAALLDLLSERAEHDIASADAIGVSPASATP